MRITLVSIIAVALVAGAAGGQNLVKVLETRDLDFLTEQAAWESSGGPEGSARVVADGARTGQRALRFEVAIDRVGPPGAAYPEGWPSCQTLLDPPQDWSAYNSLSFWVRVDSPDRKRLFPLRFILHTGGVCTLNQLIPPFRAGQWVQARFDISQLPDRDKVTRLHLFLSENEYPDKLRMAFTADGFALEKTATADAILPPRECRAALYTGQGEAWRLLEAGSAQLPCTLRVTTGAACALTPGDQVLLTARQVFTDRPFRQTMPVPQTVPAGAAADLPLTASLRGLPPGYYLLTADVLRGRRSLCQGRVGADDFYLKKPGESMAYTALSHRLGIVSWITDRYYGGMMTHNAIAMPHTYDPYNRATYPLWLRAFSSDTGKHAEGLEAGVTGLVFACEAFRRAGDTERLRYAEKLLRNNLDYMMRGMQDPDGGARTYTNELLDNYGDVLGGRGGVSQSGRDSNQVGEWVRPLARAILYYRRVPGQEAYTAKLLRAGYAAADFIIRASVAPKDGWQHVIRHYILSSYGAPLQQTTHVQEARQCEVYTGRAMAGVSYMAYAWAACGNEVPATWLQALRDTTAWAMSIMEPRGGWFDYVCEDIVEGGCHTFLGNQYIGEGTMGHYFVENLLRNRAEARAAARATKLAYRYVTDNCVIRGQKFGIPNEFWVGPYLYWELREYNTALPPDPVFAEWMQGITAAYTAKPGWVMFTGRDGKLGARTEENGSLVTSILGWLGLHYMDEIEKPWEGYL
jgi:hypothetical protein